MACTEGVIGNGFHIIVSGKKQKCFLGPDLGRVIMSDENELDLYQKVYKFKLN